MARHINDEGLALIKTFEGFSGDAYVDPVGVWTIGYGHIQGVKAGDTISEHDASNLLENELNDYERGVDSLVKVPLNDNEFSALVSFSYNVGTGALKSSTALKRLNAGDRLGAAEALEWWNKGTVNGKTFILPGLVKRRAAEKALFLKPTSDQPGTTFGTSTNVAPNTKEQPGSGGSLAGSRTIQGGTVAAGAAAAGAVGAVSQSTTKDGSATTTATTTTTTTSTTPIPEPKPTPPPAGTAPATPPPTSTPSNGPPFSLPPGVTPPGSSPSNSGATSPSATPTPSTGGAPAAPSGSGTTAPSPPAVTSAQDAITIVKQNPVGALNKVGTLLDDHPEYYTLIFGVIAIAALYVLWARIDDWAKGKR